MKSYFFDGFLVPWNKWQYGYHNFSRLKRNHELKNGKEKTPLRMSKNQFNLSYSYLSRFAEKGAKKLSGGIQSPTYMKSIPTQLPKLLNENYIRWIPKSPTRNSSIVHQAGQALRLRTRQRRFLKAICWVTTGNGIRFVRFTASYTVTMTQLHYIVIDKKHASSILIIFWSELRFRVEHNNIYCQSKQR